MNGSHREKKDDISMAVNFIDLSHTIEDGMVTYKGLPAPLICDYLSCGENGCQLPVTGVHTRETAEEKSGQLLEVVKPSDG